MEQEILDMPEPAPEPFRVQPPGMVLLITLCVVLLGAIAGSFIIMALYLLAGWDMREMMQADQLVSTASKNLLRLSLMMNHLTMFVLPALVIPFIANTRYWVLPKESFSFTLMDKKPSLAPLFWAFVIWLVSLPLIQYSYLLNKMVPIPEWASLIEDHTEELIFNLLRFDHLYEILLNVLVIAIVPALGEELIFRGILQHQLHRWAGHAWFAILMTATCFSLFHLQLEGFLPRFLLGALLGYVFYISKNIWIAIFVHFINNASMIAAYYVSPESATGEEAAAFLDDMSGWSIAFSVLSSALLTVVACYYMQKNQSKTASQ